MATVQDVTNTVTQIEAIAEEILNTATAFDPALAAPVALGEALAKIAIAALQGWSAASGTPITVESVQALLPNATPLTPPTA